MVSGFGCIGRVDCLLPRETVPATRVQGNAEVSHSYLARSRRRKTNSSLSFQRWFLKASCRPRTSKYPPLPRSGNHVLNSATTISSGICFSQDQEASDTAASSKTTPSLYHSHPQNKCSAPFLNTNKTSDQTWVPPLSLSQRSKTLPTCQQKQQNQKYSLCLIFIF